MWQVLFVLVLALGAHAQTADPYQLVGFTDSPIFKGDTGVLGFTAACQAAFGPPARMCSSVEVLETVVIQVAPLGDEGGWVRPVLRPVGFGTGGTGQVQLADASGLVAPEGNISICPLMCGFFVVFILPERQDYYSRQNVCSLFQLFSQIS